MLGEFLPVTDTELVVIDDQPVLSKSFVDGLPLHAVPEEEQDRFYRILIRSYTELTQGKAGAPMGDAYAERALMLTKKSTSNFSIYPVILRWADGLTDFLSRAPKAPSHGDLGGNNILVHRGGIFVVDLEHFVLRPFLFDIVRLPLLQMWYLRDDYLYQGLATGRFDRELGGLFAVAGFGPFSQERRLALLALLAAQLVEAQDRGRLSARFAQMLCRPYERMAQTW